MGNVTLLEVVAAIFCSFCIAAVMGYIVQWLWDEWVRLSKEEDEEETLYGDVEPIMFSGNSLKCGDECYDIANGWYGMYLCNENGVVKYATVSGNSVKIVSQNPEQVMAVQE